MISHTTFGTNDLQRAEDFFDKLLPEIGGNKYFKSDRAIFYTFGDSSSKLAISLPFDGQNASTGNGTMLAFTVPDKDKVHSVHSKALSLGAANEGDPGPRYDGMYYGAYFRDLDGNKFAVFHLLKAPVAQQLLTSSVPSSSKHRFKVKFKGVHNKSFKWTALRAAT